MTYGQVIAIDINYKLKIIDGISRLLVNFDKLMKTTATLFNQLLSLN